MPDLSNEQVWTIIREQGIPSEMPVLPYRELYKTTPRLAILSSVEPTLGGDIQTQEAFVKEFEGFAVVCDQYSSVHKLPPPWSPLMVPRFPWQKGPSLAQSLRTHCLFKHFMTACTRASEPAYALRLAACGVSATTSGVPGSGLWDQVLAELQLNHLQVVMKLGRNRSYAEVLNTMRFIMLPPPDSLPKLKPVLEALFANAAREGYGPLPKPWTPCACGCEQS